MLPPVMGAVAFIMSDLTGIPYARIALASLLPAILYYVAIYILARAAGVRLAAQTMLMQVGLALAFTLVHSIMILVLLAIFGRDAWVPRALYIMALPHVLATGAVAPIVFRIAQRIHLATVAGSPKEAGAMRDR